MYILEFLVNDIPKLKVRDDCPYEFSYHYPILMSLNTDLLCGTTGAYSFKLGRHILTFVSGRKLMNSKKDVLNRN